MNILDREQELSLAILRAVAADGDSGGVSQRTLAQTAGVALGLMNACVRRCVDKGWVKVQQTAAKRFLYFLTPIGVLEKSRLTYGYIESSLSFYRAASAAYNSIIQKCLKDKRQQVILVGDTDLTEIASLWLNTAQLDVLGCYVGRSIGNGRVFSQGKRWTDASEVSRFIDSRVAWLMTSPDAQQQYDLLLNMGVNPEQIYIPDLPDVMQIRVIAKHEVA